jgi:hypothetical protein
MTKKTISDVIEQYLRDWNSFYQDHVQPQLVWETDREDAGDAPVFAELFKDYYSRES